MRTARVTIEVAAPPHRVEQAWYETGRWPDWVDGLEEVIAIDDPWPATGGRLTWRSGPAGRGTVTEQVLDQVPGAGQTVAVTDDQLTGEQTVLFTADEDETRVELELTYALRRRNPLTALINALFIRRAMADALGRTLERFAVAAESPRGG
jgi:uncharacterized membrane protein